MANANMTMTVKLDSADRKLLERIARALEKANGVTYRMDVPAYRDIDTQSADLDPKEQEL